MSCSAFKRVPKLTGLLVSEWEEPERHGLLQVLANAACTQVRSVVEKNERETVG